MLLATNRVQEYARRCPPVAEHEDTCEREEEQDPSGSDDSEKVKQSGAVSLGSDPDRNVATLFSKRRLQGASDGALARGC